MEDRVDPYCLGDVLSDRNEIVETVVRSATRLLTNSTPYSVQSTPNRMGFAGRPYGVFILHCTFSGKLTGKYFWAGDQAAVRVQGRHASKQAHK